MFRERTQKKQHGERSTRTGKTVSERAAKRKAEQWGKRKLRHKKKKTQFMSRGIRADRREKAKGKHYRVKCSRRVVKEEVELDEGGWRRTYERTLHPVKYGKRNIDQPVCGNHTQNHCNGGTEEKPEYKSDGLRNQ